jgi:hypothetical protein
MGYLSLFVSVFRLLIFKFCDKTYATKPFLTITSAQDRFGCICSLGCKLQLFNFATKPFHVTRSAKRPRHNHPIGTAIYSMKAKHVFTRHRVFQMVEIDVAAKPHSKLKLFNVFAWLTMSGIKLKHIRWLHVSLPIRCSCCLCLRVVLRL